MEKDNQYKSDIESQLEYLKKWKDESLNLYHSMGDIKNKISKVNEDYDFIKKNIFNYNRGKKINLITNILISISAIFVTGHVFYNHSIQKDLIKKNDIIFNKTLSLLNTKIDKISRIEEKLKDIA